MKRPAACEAHKSYFIKILRVAEPGAPAASILTPKKALAYWRAVICRKQWWDENKEHLITILLSTRHHALGFSLVSIGSLNESIAHPREIFRNAIACGAYGFVLMHNHPSGDPSPSAQDISLTGRIRDCAKLLEIAFLDHIIVGQKNRIWSAREHSLYEIRNACQDFATGRIGRSANGKNRGCDTVRRVQRVLREA